MAYSCKFIRSTESSIESDIADFLNTASPTTIHQIQSFKYGTQIYTIITYE